MSGVSRIRGGAAAAVVLAASATLVACASGNGQHVRAAAQHPSASPLGVVQVKTFSPYAATGTIAVPVADHVSGSCWTGSIAVPVAVAYRCLAGDQIYDPCFAPAPETHPPTVACVPDPWTPARLVTLTAPLPPASPPAQGHDPWALELANNARCVAVTGTVASVDGVALNYLCGPGMGAAIVQNDGTRILVDYGSETGNSLASVAVVTMWRG